MGFAPIVVIGTVREPLLVRYPGEALGGIHRPVCTKFSIRGNWKKQMKFDFFEEF